MSLYTDEDRDYRPMTMVEESSWQHANFGTCSFDCWRCQPMDDQEEPEPVYLVQSPYGTISCLTFAEAKWQAQVVAKTVGKAVKVVKV